MKRSEAVRFLNDLLLIDVEELIKNYNDPDAKDMGYVMLSGYDLYHILESIVNHEYASNFARIKPNDKEEDNE